MLSNSGFGLYVVKCACVSVCVCVCVSVCAARRMVSVYSVLKTLLDDYDLLNGHLCPERLLF